MLRDRFCTDELKIQIAFDAAIKPLLDDGEVVVQWSGVRADESSKRAGYDRFSKDERDPDYLYNFLPIHQWTAADVFALHKYFGISPNPLYTQGASRVGCMNCVLCTKEEISETAARWPEHIEKHHAWEKKVRLASRWVHWMSVGTVSQAWMRSHLGFRDVIQFDEDEFTGEEVVTRRRYPVNLGKDVKLYGLEPDVQRIECQGFTALAARWAHPLRWMSSSGLKPGAAAKFTTWSRQAWTPLYVHHATDYVNKGAA
nr:phosphoadenosine phosphosulfate reductase family protein [Atlantibacter hermannii]